MLKLYRRHLRVCKHFGKARNAPRTQGCSCPVWVQGTLNGEVVRKSLDLTSWEAASEKVRVWEASGAIGAACSEVPSVAETIRRFLSDAEARHLADSTIQKLRVVLEKQLLPWCRSQGLSQLRQLDVESVRSFRASWKDGAISSKKKLERLRSFFRFCVDSGWLKVNPAKAIKAPRVIDPPTMPFTVEELNNILAGCENFPIVGRANAIHRKKLKALVLTMRYSGLRIGDTVFLKRSDFDGNKLRLRTEKTGTVVYCPLPQIVLDALAEIDYNFVDSEAKPKHVVGSYQRSFRKIGKTLGFRFHAHRLRDTAAVGWLMAGISVEDVAVLLGHQSIRITERHYSPWIRERQIRLEKLVQASWV